MRHYKKEMELRREFKEIKRRFRRGCASWSDCAFLSNQEQAVLWTRDMELMEYACIDEEKAMAYLRGE